MDDTEGELAYAEMAVHAGRPEEAERVYRKLEGKRVDSARAAASLGLIALARKQTAEAKRYFEQAMGYPDVEAHVPFEYAMLLREEGAPREQVRRYLDKAVAIHPRFAEAHFLIGVAEANENRHSEAVPHLERAARVFPRQSYFWHALAVSYQALGRRQESRGAAQRALDAAANAEQVEMARAALRLSEEVAPTQPVAPRQGESVITPDSWRRSEGNARAEGVLVQIDCLGESARFVVRSSSGKLMRFFVEKPGEVLLKNLSSATFEFRCGAQKPVPVVVEYRAEASEQQMTVGVVTGLEFR
jgi:tetratricopeptide (TPR) repeat protein